MDRAYLITAFTLAAMPYVAPLQSQVGPTATLRTEIQQAVRAYIEGHNKFDAATIADMYSRQPGVTSVGDGEITRGWDRIRDAFDKLVGSEGRFRVDIGSIDVTPLGPGYALALTSYTITLNVAGQEVQQRGTMTLVFQRTEGEWKIIHDHTSSQAEAGGPAAVSQGAGQPAAPAQAAPNQGAGVPSVTTIPITDGQAVEIKAASFVHYTFQLPAGTCTITGRIVGISGGNKDFEALIMDDDNFRNWSAGTTGARALWQSGRVVVTAIDNAVVAGPGTFHLVVSNAWSIATPKTVQAQALARCSR